MKRSLWNILVIVVFCQLLTGCATEEDQQMTVDPFFDLRGDGYSHWSEGISSYCVYYGKDPVNTIPMYDFAILEPSHYQPREVRNLNDETRTAGYLSVGETSQLLEGNGEGPGGYASWYVDRDDDGTPDRNENWNSYFVDARDPGWREHVVDRADRILGEKHFQGLFLDTVTTADRFPETKPGMVRLVRKLKRTYPDARLILNYSPSVYPDVLASIDGVMVESAFCYYDREKETYRRRSGKDLKQYRQQLRNIRSRAEDHRDRLLFLALDYAGPDEQKKMRECRRKARNLGYLSFVSTLDLRIPPPPPEWLE